MFMQIREEQTLSLSLSLCKHIAKWADLEKEVKNGVRGHKNNYIYISTKMITLETIWWLDANGINDFAGTVSWWYRLMKKHCKNNP
jgi:hypothetical protein